MSLCRLIFQRYAKRLLFVDFLAVFPFQLLAPSTNLEFASTSLSNRFGVTFRPRSANAACRFAASLAVKGIATITCSDLPSCVRIEAPGWRCGFPCRARVTLVSDATVVHFSPPDVFISPWSILLLLLLPQTC